MSALEYQADLSDIRFVLFEQLGVQDELSSISTYSEFDRELYDATLEEAARIAAEVLAPINRVGDVQGCTLHDDGSITTPDGFKEAWNVLADGGWIAVGAPVEAGGAGLPQVMSIAVVEMFIGAAMAFQMYPGLTAAAARVIDKFGADDMRQTYVQKMFCGQWAGTMCLTESGAGSDVGENRCKAVRADDGSFLLEGEKIFISGGDHDLTENIVHLVLARTPGSPAGTKGLSLFVVPKFLVNSDGSLGERNGIVATKIEEKMGIHGSSTCVLTLGSSAPCRGFLIGDEHEGIRIMFHMMNEARIGVGAQGVAMSSAATSYARRYAKERLQGSLTEDFGDADAPRAAIIEHPDVRRMLMHMQATTHAMRSMLYRLSLRHELAKHQPERAERDNRRVELLVPILKAMCTDMGFDNAVMGLQVLGGYGYIGEYPLEQLVRDAKITSIYEGTNGIQALDLLGRKLRQNNGQLLMEWMEDALADCDAATLEGLEEPATAIRAAVESCGAAAMHLGALGMQNQLDAALVQATPFLHMMGIVHLHIESLHQARVAQASIANQGTTPHRQAKLHNLRFMVANVLPRAIAFGKQVRSGDATCLDPELFR